MPAFAAHLDAVIDVPHLGKVTVDVGWGGMFYVIADVRQFAGLELIPEHGREIARISSLIRQAAIEQLPVDHPDYPGVGITISQLSGPSGDPSADWRNAVTMSSGDFSWDRPATWTGALDRCSCGTGTCAKMAVLHTKGELALHQPFRHQGIWVIFTLDTWCQRHQFGGETSSYSNRKWKKLDLQPKHYSTRP